MNEQSIASLFRLFSGAPDEVQYLTLIRAAMEEVTRKLRDPAYVQEFRLCYLAAAIANLHFTQVFGARSNSLATYAGTLARPSNTAQQTVFAKDLVRGYTALCQDLLVDEGFLFTGIRGC